MEDGTVTKDNSVTKCTKKFTFTYNNGNNRLRTLKLPVNVAEHQNCVELMNRVAGHHRIPCFVEKELQEALQSFIEKERIKSSEEEASALVTTFNEKPENISKIAKSISTKYKKTWAQYTETNFKQEGEQFSSMYHKCIHSKAMTLLLALEEHYYTAVQKVLSDQQNNMTRLRERQELEMQRTCEHVSTGSLYSEYDVNRLAEEHESALEKALQEWKSKYIRVTQSQREEYRRVVSRLYSEMMENHGKVNENGQTYIEVKKVVEVSERAKVNRLSTMNDSPTVPAVSPSKRGQRKKNHTLESNEAKAIPNESSLHLNTIYPRLEESFTINLGAQMKTMHNIRLVATPILHFCRHNNQSGDLQAQRLQTVLSLYSNGLSGIVLLVDNNVDSVSPLKADFASICEGSTEFHFPSYNEQLEEMKCKRALSGADQASLKSDDNVSINSSSSEKSTGDGQFKDGDIYVTKHSNLSRVHVAFHLVANTTRLKSPESSTTVSSRHPAILGLRHILKIMSSHDVSTLMIPLLLCHEFYESVGDEWLGKEAWIVKRAELVMKCMKGFMMEMAAWDGGISRTIQFVLPHGIEDHIFYRLSSMLPEIFRTTTARNLTSPRISKSAASASPKPARH